MEKSLACFLLFETMDLVILGEMHQTFLSTWVSSLCGRMSVRVSGSCDAGCQCVW